jgi:hypothetical protein
MSRSTLSTAEALKARAARAHEDPRAMTQDAMLGRLAKHVVAIVRKNPDLDDAAVAKGARLKLRAEMAELAEKSKAARAEREAGTDQPVTA